MNASSLVVALGLLIGIAVSTTYLRSAGPALRSTYDFHLVFAFYAVATVLELLSESSFIVIQQNAMFRDRALAETSAAIVRCLGAVFAAFYLRHVGSPTSALPFAVGQLCYAATLLVLYLMRATRVARAEQFSLAPSKLRNSDAVLSLIPRKLFRLAGAFYGQSVFKWLLTQGDTLFLSYFADLQSQGIFAHCKVKEYAIEEQEGWRKVLLIDAVQDPGNIGTMIRTADAAGLARCSLSISRRRTREWRRSPVVAVAVDLLPRAWQQQPQRQSAGAGQSTGSRTRSSWLRWA